MTTPINSILVTNNVKPNDDIQDPIVQEILGNMAESASQQQPQPQPIQQPNHNTTYNHNIIIRLKQKVVL